MASKLSSTNVRDLIIDCVVIIKQVFRDILKTQIQPEDLYLAIQSCSDVHKGRYKVNPEQMKIYFPTPSDVPDYDKFDISFFFSLFWKLCQEGEKHLSQRTIKIDDIKKLINLKDKLYAILESTAQTTGDYLESRSHLSAELNSILEELKRNLQSGNLFVDYAHYEKKINKMEEIYPFLASATPESTLLRKFFKWFKSKYETFSVVRLFLGEQIHDQPTNEEKEQVIVLVIDHSDVIADEFYQCDGKEYKIVCKLWRHPPPEGVKVSSLELDCNIEIKKISDIEACIEKRSKELFEEHSNLEFITMSAFRSRNDGENINFEPCIALFCSCKGVMPLNEKEFPRQLDDISTDIREGFFFQGAGSYVHKETTDILDPLRMGANIAKKGNSYSGTLGGFVTIGSGEIGFITAAHNFLNISNIHYSDEEFEVVQPNEPNVCGTHVKSFGAKKIFENENTLDAALVKITSRKPTRGIFAGKDGDELKLAGYSLAEKPEYNDGAFLDFRRELLPNNDPCTCIKVGATTGLTEGTLWTVGMSAKWMDNYITFEHEKLKPKAMYYNQLHLNGNKKQSSFIKFGDSGALVFQVVSDETKKKRLLCIGMAVGFTTDNRAVVTPIDPILKSLKVKLHKFNTGTMDIP